MTWLPFDRIQFHFSSNIWKITLWDHCDLANDACDQLHYLCYTSKRSRTIWKGLGCPCGDQILVIDDMAPIWWHLISFEIDFCKPNSIKQGQCRKLNKSYKIWCWIVNWVHATGIKEQIIVPVSRTRLKWRNLMLNCRLACVFQNWKMEWSASLCASMCIAEINLSIQLGHM
jgi:hypothetical protein